MVKNIIARYTKTFPLTLFRVQNSSTVFLRDLQSQKAKGRSAYDVVLKEDGLYHPAPVHNNLFVGPNGASLRPNSLVMHEILDTFPEEAVVFIIPKGTPIPNQFVLYHERSDHYSLQTTLPISLSVYNTRLANFLQQFEKISKAEFRNRFPVDEATP